MSTVRKTRRARTWKREGGGGGIGGDFELARTDQQPAVGCHRQRATGGKDKNAVRMGGWSREEGVEISEAPAAGVESFD